MTHDEIIRALLMIVRRALDPDTKPADLGHAAMDLIQAIEDGDRSDDGAGDLDVPHVDLLVVSADGSGVLGPISCQALAAAIAYGGMPVGPDGWTVQGDKCHIRISRGGEASDECS